MSNNYTARKGRSDTRYCPGFSAKLSEAIVEEGIIYSFILPQKVIKIMQFKPITVGSVTNTIKIIEYGKATRQEFSYH